MSDRSSCAFGVGWKDAFYWNKEELFQGEHGEEEKKSAFPGITYWISLAILMKNVLQKIMDSQLIPRMMWVLSHLEMIRLTIVKAFSLQKKSRENVYTYWSKTRFTKIYLADRASSPRILQIKQTFAEMYLVCHGKGLLHYLKMGITSWRRWCSLLPQNKYITRIKPK